MNNPFTLMRQQQKIVFNFRVNDEFWSTSDVEHMLIDLRPAFRKGWHLAQCVRTGDQIEVHLARNTWAWRAFMEPYAVVR